MSKIGPEDYNKRLPAIKENFEIAKTYWRVDDQLADKIMEIVKMTKEISIICPTHKRKVLQTRFAENVYNNCSNPSTCEIVFGIDNNDEVGLTTAESLRSKYGEDFIRVCLIEPGKTYQTLATFAFLFAEVRL